MYENILSTLEQKVGRAVELIELLRLQVEELEQENSHLKEEQNRWRHDLTTLIHKFDEIEAETLAAPTTTAQPATAPGIAPTATATPASATAPTASATATVAPNSMAYDTATTTETEPEIVSF